MPDASAREVFNRRLPLYAYLEPLVVGRRVLEIGCGAGAAADYLAAHGVERMVAVDTDPSLVERARARHRRPNLDLRSIPNLTDLTGLGERFDVVIVPEADALIRDPDAVAAWKHVLADGGRLIVAAGSSDRRGATGVGYYELSDALQPHFEGVQMFGVTPFAGFGVVEFDGGVDGLRVDSRLVEGGAEPPTAYLAVAGGEPAAGLGYALVQVPFAPIEARLAAGAEASDRGAEARAAASERRLEEAERRARSRVEEAEGRIAELRRKLEDASVQSESAMRIARAQGEEMEELRGRLRRAAEDRAALDAEMAKLRRALAEADESVMSLTRRTAEEMSVVAQRLAAGLRAPEPDVRDRMGDVGSLRDQVERLRVELAETEARASAAEQRLEAVGTAGREGQAALQDALERLRIAEDATVRERREVARLQAEVRAAVASARSLDQRETALAARDERIARLEGEKQDLTWRLAELEEKLREAIARAVVADVGRGHSDELTAARAARDRALEEFHKAGAAHVQEVTQLRSSVSEQAALVAELEESVRAAEARAAAAGAEAAVLRKNAKGLEEADRTRRSRLAELEGKLLRLEHERKADVAAAASAAAAPSPAPAVAGASPAALAVLEGRLAEVTRERDELRGNLDRIMRVAAENEEALWKAKDQLGGTRERIVTLESELGRLRDNGPRNGHDLVGATLARELEAIEAGVREELDALAEIERAVEAEMATTAAPGTAAGGAAAAGTIGSSPEDDGAEVILLHTTLGNYRRRAGRLRDELEGMRRRVESLSPSQISGYLEELGEDLAELEK